MKDRTKRPNPNRVLRTDRLGAMQRICYNGHNLLHRNLRSQKPKKEPDLERRNRLDSLLFAVTVGASGGGGQSAAHLSSLPSWSALASPGGGAGVSPDNERSVPLSRDRKGVFIQHFP